MMRRFRIEKWIGNPLDGRELSQFNEHSFGDTVFKETSKGTSNYIKNRVDFRDEDGSLCLRKVYYQLEVEGEWVGYTEIIKWYKTIGGVGQRYTKKFDLSDDFSKLRLYKKTVRENQFLVMLDKARRNNNISNSDIDTLIDHYEGQYLRWIRNGSKVLINSVNSEENTSINILLNKYVDAGETVTIKESINIIAG